MPVGMSDTPTTHDALTGLGAGIDETTETVQSQRDY